MTEIYEISMQLVEVRDDGRSREEIEIDEDGCGAFETHVSLERFQSIFNMLKIVLNEQWNSKESAVTSSRDGQERW